MSISDRIDQVFEEWVKEGKGFPMTQRELAKRVGCSKQFIGQIEQLAFKELRKQLRLIQ